jgi:hypothetical protein
MTETDKTIVVGLGTALMIKDNLTMGNKKPTKNKFKIIKKLCFI